LTTRDYQFIALVVALLLILFIALVFVNLRLQGGGGDFYVHWVASRSFLFDRIEPYSGEVPARVQALVYGQAAQPGEEPYILDTPFDLLLLYFPVSLPADARLARAIFTAFLELALCAFVFISLLLTGWQVPRLFYPAFAIFALFNFYTLQAIYESNPVILLSLIYAGILFLLNTDLDELLGALLAASFYYWEVGGPFLFLVILRVYHEGRVRVFAGFLMMSFILLATSFFLYPDWIIPFLRASFNNLRADFGHNLHDTFDHLMPGVSQSLAWVFIVVILVVLGYEWSMARDADFRRFHWAACLTLAVTPLLGVRTEMEHLVVMTMPLALVFAIVHDRWRRFGNGLTLSILLLVFVPPWLVYFLVPERVRADVLFLFMPVLAILGLYWVRWWALRPPRTWIDLANRS
jgi:hypothetical protein